MLRLRDMVKVRVRKSNHQKFCLCTVGEIEVLVHDLHDQYFTSAHGVEIKKKLDTFNPPHKQGGHLLRACVAG